MDKTVRESLKYAVCSNGWNIFITILNIVSGLCAICGVSIRDWELLWIKRIVLFIFIITAVIIIRRFLKHLNKCIRDKDFLSHNLNNQLSSFKTRL